MAENNEFTTYFNADISDLNKGIQDANRQIKLADSEFKAATGGMEKWSDDADGLSAKISALEKTLNAHNQKLAIYEEEYRQVVEEQGEASKAAENLLIRINKEKAAIGAAEKDINNYSNALDTMADEASGSADSVDELSDAANDTNGGFTVAKGAIADFISNGLSSLASKVGEAVSSIANLAEETREYREDMNKLDSAFATAGYSTDTAKSAYQDFYAVLGESDRSVEAVNHLAQLTNSEQELQQWTTICEGVWATFGDSLPIEGLTEAANETAKTGTVTGVLADALNWVGKSEDEFNQELAACTSEQERSSLITSTLNGLYSEAAQNYEAVNGSVMDANRATAELTDAQAELGAMTEPVTTAVTQGFSSLLAAVTELASGIDWAGLSAAISGAFQWLSETALPAIISGIQTTASVINTLSPAIVAVGVAIAGLALVGLISNIGAVATALVTWASSTKIVTAAQWLLNAAMSANPIGLIVIAIAALVAAFVVLWNKSEAFREFWIGLWEKIKAAFSVVADWVTARAQEWVDGIKAIWDVVQPYFQAVWNGIKTVFSVVKAVLTAYFETAWQAIKIVWDAVSGYFQAVWNNINTVFSVVKTVLEAYFKSAWEAIKVVWDAVKGYFELVWSNIKGVFSVVKSVLSGDFNGAWDEITLIWDGVKGYFEGVWKDVKNVFNSVSTFFSTAFGNAWKAIKGVFNGWGDFFGGLWKTIKDKFSGLGTSISNAIGSAVKSGINSVISLIENRINSAISIINGAISVINALPGVSVGQISGVSLPRLAKGGIIDKATTAVIGEDGSEAIVPLENNTEWLDAVAARILSGISGNSLAFGSSGIAGGVVNNFYQTNTSPKALSSYEIRRQTKILLKMGNK